MRKNRWRNFVGIASLSFILGLGTVAAPMSVSAATEHWNDATLTGTEGSWEDYKKNWEETRDNWKHVSLTPGKNESELNFAWYSTTKETPMVKIATDKAMKEGVKEFKGTQEELSSDEKSRSDINGYYSNKVEVTGLEENTEYYYQVFQDGEWKEPQSYKTESFSSYSFLYVGDPQVGACKGQTDSQGNEMTKTKPDYLAARNDSYNWNEILNQAVDKHPDVSFMVSAGDQVNYADEEREYAGYLGAEALTSLPVATTIGNHDSGSAQYSWHFNNPNTQEDAGDAYTEGRTQAGTDYYFTYGDVLFIFIDTNNYNCATHENVIKKAVEENQDKKWRVVTFHQDIYGSGKDHSDTDGMVLRTQLTPIMDKYDIDVVLQGHDHTYSRTYQLVSDGKEHGAYTKGNYKDNLGDFQADNNCYEIVSDVKGGTVTNPEGTVYFEANSATGSKFYELIPSQQDFIAERSQTWTPTYSVIDVTEDTFSVTTYDSTTQEKLEGSDTYTIKKTKNQKSQDDKNQ
ncbi:MAG: metallophosphoesterase family protein, partial [Eubacteriales bacterium]|nr:metallophosphoesterase family protein [Eubacteriales bacterium]